MTDRLTPDERGYALRFAMARALQPDSGVDGLMARLVLEQQEELATNERHLDGLLRPGGQLDQLRDELEDAEARVRELEGALLAACDWLDRLIDFYDPENTEDGKVDVARWRNLLTVAGTQETCAKCGHEWHSRNWCSTAPCGCSGEQERTPKVDTTGGAFDNTYGPGSRQSPKRVAPAPTQEEK